MRIILTLLAITNLSCVQLNSDWKDVEVDAKQMYPIDQENELYDMSDFKVPDDTIRAALEVSNDKHLFSSIKLTEARMSNDTLKILIYRTDAAYHHEYSIYVASTKYFIKYRFAGAGGFFDEIMVPIQTKLKLNTLEFTEGAEVKGYTEFICDCVRPCKKGWLSVKGNFKAVVTR